MLLRKGTGGGSATAPSSGESSDSVSSVSHSRLSTSLSDGVPSESSSSDVHCVVGTDPLHGRVLCPPRRIVD